MVKTYIVDTNVLLSEPRSIFSFQENEVILPFTIIEELDKIKSRPNQVGANAREMARILCEIIDSNPECSLKDGIPLQNGGVLKVLSVSDFEDGVTLAHELDPSNKDNHIIGVCHGLMRKTVKLGINPPILVTKDILLRVKCNTLGIPCEDYKGLDVAETVESIFRGHTVLNVSDQVIQSYFESVGDTCLSVDLNPLFEEAGIKKPLLNEFVVLDHPSIANADDRPFVRWIGNHYLAKMPEPISEKNGVYGLRARNLEQKMSLDLLLDSNIHMVTMLGSAGTGKSLLAIAAGLQQVIEKKIYKRLVVLKPTIAVGVEQGFLPGTKDEKLLPWLAPIMDNLRQLMFSGKKSKYNESMITDLMEDGTIELEAITYLRGRSISDAYIIIDESQNCSAHELKTILTRVGENSKIVLTGDVEQIDNVYLDAVSNGLAIAIEKFKGSDITGTCTLLKGERSKLATLAAKVL